MKSKSAKLLSVILAALMIMSIIPVTAGAYAKEGIFTYDVEDGHAVITDIPYDASGTITVPDTLGGYPVTVIGRYGLAQTSYVSKIILPDTITEIRDLAFTSDKALTSIVIPEGVTSIGNEAFKYCYNLKSITLPSTLKTIGNNAFQGCELLKSITIPEGVTSIGEEAFIDCDALTTVSLPSTLTRLGKDAFEETPFLSKESSYEDGALYCGTTLVKVNAKGAFNIKDGTTLIAEGAFRYAEVTEVSIPSSITAISDYAFYYCKSIRYITIPDSVTSIGSHAFASTYVGSIKIPDSVTYIGDYAFYDCYSLKTVIIPKSVKEIGASAFNKCWSIESAVILAPLEAIPERMFYDCNELASVSIPASVKAIGEQAFYDCTKLKDVNYAGKEAKWNEIEIAANNSPLLAADVHYSAKIKATGSFEDSTKAKVSDKLILADIGLTLYQLSLQASMGTSFLDADGNVLAPGATITTGTKVVLADNTELTVSLDGDVDCDGALAAADARIALRAAVGLENLSAAQKKAADKEEDGTITAADARIILRVSVGLPEVEPEEPKEPEKPALTISAEQYSYLAGTDFRSIRRDYPHAVANGAYVVAFVNENGEQCILTYVSYKIQTNWSATTLHNITTGRTIKDPEEYYDKQASAAWGANRLKYMNLKSEVMAKELVCMREYSNILKTGKHSGAGAYVDARTLNL